MPKLVLITVSSPEIRTVRRSRVLNFQQITMPYLAARVPPDWHVVHIDEEAEEIDWNIEADVIGITFHTPSAYHAYHIATRFRSRGICVAMGGPHVTLLPEEASQYADVIFIGEAEGLWEEFLKSFEAGSYLHIYQQTKVPSLENIPMARKALFHRHDHTGGVLFATRGCPNRCDFCTIAVMYRRALRKRPIAEVVAEYASFRGKVIIFWDDNIAGDMAYAKELFRAIAPYRKWWSSQASIQAGRDDEFLQAARRSGCKQLFLGLESISQRSMTEVNKGFNRVEEYSQIIERIHSHGIAVQAGIVFGFDNDTPEIFKDTLDFLEETGVQNATFNILTPFPGTPIYRKMEAEGRILTRNWRKYNSRSDVVYRPKRMSAAELLAGFRYANERFYSLPSIAKRLSRSPVQIEWTLPLNLAYSYSTVVFCHFGLDYLPTMSTIGFQSLCQCILPSVTAKQRDNLQQDCWIETVSQPTDASITNPQTATKWQFAIAVVQRVKSQTVQPNLLGAGAPFDYDWAWFDSERGRFVFPNFTASKRQAQSGSTKTQQSSSYQWRKTAQVAIEQPYAADSRLRDVKQRQT